MAGGLSAIVGDQSNFVSLCQQWCRAEARWHLHADQTLILAVRTLICTLLSASSPAPTQGCSPQLDANMQTSKKTTMHMRHLPMLAQPGCVLMPTRPVSTRDQQTAGAL